VLVSHDRPAGAAIPGMTAIPEAEQHQARLRRICWARQPAYVHHGHLHAHHNTRHEDGTWRGRIIALDSLDRPSHALAVLDLDELAIELSESDG
jgi:hypothetical protein